MVTVLLRSVGRLVAALLLLFTARRWLFTLAALLPERPVIEPPSDSLPTVLLLVPAHNEAEALPSLLVALDKLIYPARRLQIVLLDDGSTDGTRPLLESWAVGRPNWAVLSLPGNIGKARALNRALQQVSAGEIVAIYDADERPAPECLVKLAAPFTDERVGAVSGRRAIHNALAGPAAAYSTFEGIVHQLVTMRAKDRLGLAPASLGSNCAYRRTALNQVGAFLAGALLEDSDLSLKLPLAGWQTRFAPQAVSYHAVPHTVAGYWRQHTRWARGFNDVARDHIAHLLTNRRLPLLLRLELLVFALGYLDRLALAGGGLLYLVRKWSRFPGRVLGLSLGAPLLQTVVALKIDRAPPALWIRLIWLPLFFAVDLAMAAWGLRTALGRAPRIWEERQRRN